MTMIDAHCHLDSFEFAESDMNKIVTPLRAVITAGAGFESSERCVEIASNFENVFATIGLGYEEKIGEWNDAWEKLEAIYETNKNKIVGIGECGLDEASESEIGLLKFHLEFAKSKNLPLVIHNRGHDDQILSTIGEYSEVMMHCFTGDLDSMRRFEERGWYMSFSGIVSFKKSDYLREVVSKINIDHLLIETDAPYIAPEPVRGGVNLPINVKYIYEVISKCRSVDLSDLEEKVVANMVKLFKINI